MSEHREKQKEGWERERDGERNEKHRVAQLWVYEIEVRSCVLIVLVTGVIAEALAVCQPNPSLCYLYQRP